MVNFSEQKEVQNESIKTWKHRDRYVEDYMAKNYDYNLGQLPIFLRYLLTYIIDCLLFHSCSLHIHLSSDFCLLLFLQDLGMVHVLVEIVAVSQYDCLSINCFVFLLT